MTAAVKAKERPILFSAPMVRAILAGTKTQTRRVMERQLGNAVIDGKIGRSCFTPDGKVSVRGRTEEGEIGEWFLRPRYGMKGDRLVVREAWKTADKLDDLDAAGIAKKAEEAGYARPWAPLLYLADGARVNWEDSAVWGEPGRYRHARFMPRWASRITLEVTDVRVQRLHEISEEDARAEGLTAITKDGGRTIKYGIPDRDGLPGTDDDGWPWSEWSADPREAFKRLWCRINGPESWEANPLIWAISFRRLS